MIAPLAKANCLVLREPCAPAAKASSGRPDACFLHFKLGVGRAPPSTCSYKPALLRSLMLTSFFDKLQTLRRDRCR